MSNVSENGIARAAIQYRLRWKWLPTIVHMPPTVFARVPKARTGSAGKHPRFDEWHLLNPSVAEIADWFRQCPGSNEKRVPFT